MRLVVACFIMSVFIVIAVAQDDPPTEPYNLTMDPAQDVEIQYGIGSWQPIAVQNVEVVDGAVGDHSYVAASGTDHSWEAKTPETMIRKVRFSIPLLQLPAGYYWYRIRCRVRLLMADGITMSDPGPWSDEPAFWVFVINKPGKPQRP